MSTAVDVPTLETERLRLRAHRASDFNALCALWSDLAVVRFTAGSPVKPNDVWTRLLRSSGHWALQGYGFWIVEEKATGALIGEMGFANFERDIAPPLVGPYEAGWILGSLAHGKGYATEAMQRVLAWGTCRFPGEETVCIIDKNNTPSMRVAEKLGYSVHHEAVMHGSDVIVLARQF